MEFKGLVMIFEVDKTDLDIKRVAVIFQVNFLYLVVLFNRWMSQGVL